MNQKQPRRAGMPALAREVTGAIQEELSDIAAYTANSVLLSPYLPAIAELYGETSITEMKHYRHLSELAAELGASPYPKFSVRPTSYCLNEDADSHAIVVARRMLSESIADEKAASAAYRRLSECVTDEKLKKFFADLSADEAAHAKAFAAALCRLDRS